MKAMQLLLSLLLSFLFALWTHRVEIGDRYAMYDDAAIYYVLRAQTEPGSLGKDLLANSLGGGAVSGAGGMRVLSGPLLPVERAAARAYGLREMLLAKAILLQTAAGTMALALGLSLGFGGWAWGFWALFMAYFSSTDVFFGGLHRGYGPLLALALYYFAEKGSLAGALAVTAGFYAFYGASFPFSSCVVILMLVADAEAKYRRCGWALLLLFAAAPFAALLFKPEFVAGINSAFSWKADFNTAGFLSPEIYFFNMNEHSPVYRWLTWALFAAAGAAFFQSRSAWRKFPAGDRLFAGAIALSFAWAYFLDPGLSSRQVVHSLPLFLALFPFRRLISMAPGQLRTAALWGMAALPLSASLFGETPSDHITQVSPVVMQALAALPTDSLLLVHPETAMLAGFFAGRSTYANDKWEGLLCGFSRGPLCGEVRERNRKVFEIYYAASPAGTAGFAAASGVTHFVVEERFYLPEYLGGLGHFRRLSGRSALAFAGGGVALLDLAREKGVMLEPGAWLLETGRLKGGKK